jgi:hypothetical protein
MSGSDPDLKNSSYAGLDHAILPAGHPQNQDECHAG